jgi:acetyl esterase/lipase
LLFIHGGYWQHRDKEVFTVVAEGPMAHGINVALIGHTLAPDATLDAMRSDHNANPAGIRPDSAITRPPSA